MDTSDYTIDQLLQMIEDASDLEMNKSKTSMDVKNSKTVGALLFEKQIETLNEYGVSIEDLKLSTKPLNKKNVKRCTDETTGITLENEKTSELVTFIHFKPVKVEKDSKNLEYYRMLTLTKPITG
ncbi:hypothetical protein [Brevibacillus sp. H7]|uniref:hypothetical protein n=1 Tax=Brevibacillus sp. H7 TaxID=3349138 RepID=UPI0038166D69